MDKISKGYKSDVKLPISQTPSSTGNPEVFADLVEVYNSVHILNAQTEAIKNQSFNLNKETPLEEQMSFKYTLWIEAAQAIAPGKLVTITSAGATLGWSNRGFKVPIGMALTEATEGGQLIKVGFGPALIKFDTANYGDNIYVITGRSDSAYPKDPYGSLTTQNSIEGYRLEAVGSCYIPGYVFLFTAENYSIAPFFP